MIRPYPRYAELHARRHHADGFTRQDVIDLQVWHKLVWMDPDWLKTDPRLQRLLALGRNFDEPDKRILREVELELLNAVIPAYTRAAARGQIEVSTSPFYHPILPLLCDSDVHFRAQPHSALPRGLIRRPAAARQQIERALAFHREQFGALPSGMWPSEGSLSDEVVAMLAEHGVGWTATDEEILARSLQQAASAAVLYRPYEVGESGQSIRCLFRDHRLSDLIGFTYQSWDAQRAADDFLLQVRDGGRRFRADAPAGETPVVSVILDGENAWEHYPGGGRPFLRALYGALATATDIETVPMRVAAAGPARRLRQLFPGSWINGDFYIWAGHADDHRAWSQVADAYASLDAETDEAGRARATDELLIAEGSDWFWWYGDDHSSDQDAEFDDLFRRHVRNSYTTRGAEPPVALYTSNITTGGAKVTPVSFRALSTPTMSGEAGDVGDWRSAVSVPLRRGGGTMAQVSGPADTRSVAGSGPVDAVRPAAEFGLAPAGPGGNGRPRTPPGSPAPAPHPDRPSGRVRRVRARRRFRLPTSAARPATRCVSGFWSPTRPVMWSSSNRPGRSRSNSRGAIWPRSTGPSRSTARANRPQTFHSPYFRTKYAGSDNTYYVN